MVILKNAFSLAAILMLCCSCVSRTITRTPTISEAGKGKANENGKIIEKKIVWFWEDDF